MGNHFSPPDTCLSKEQSPTETQTRKIHAHGYMCWAWLPLISHAGTPWRGHGFARRARDGAFPAQTDETKGGKSKVIFCLVSRSHPRTHSPERDTLRGPSPHTPARLAPDSRGVDAWFAAS